MVNHATNDLKTLMANTNAMFNPAILQQMQELTAVRSSIFDEPTAPVVVPHKNPFRAKSGLLFRDILKRADNTQSCSSCGTKK
jgi:hypothetical protein